MIQAEDTLVMEKSGEKAAPSQERDPYKVLRKNKQAPDGAYITLESFLAYKGKQETRSYEFYPTPRDVTPGDPPSVVLGDIPLPDGVPAPKNALTVLYGFRDTLEELHRQHTRARQNAMTVVKVSFKLQVRDLIAGATDEELLKRSDFLHLRRVHSSLSDLVVDGVNSLLQAEANAQGKSAEYFTRMSEACARPDLVCDTIRQQPEFAHIKAVAYFVPDPTTQGGKRQVATIFTDKIEQLDLRGEMPFNLTLPALEAGR